MQVLVSNFTSSHCLDCYNMRKLFFSMDQLPIAESMVDIIRVRSGRPERSLEIYRNAMEVYKEYLPDYHIQIANLLAYEGDAHAELLDFASATDRYQKAKEILQKVVGEGHVVEADILGKSLRFTFVVNCCATSLLTWHLPYASQSTSGGFSSESVTTTEQKRSLVKR